MFSDNETSKYYKRQGQRKMLEILDGKCDSAIIICKHTLSVQPNDLESYFNLSVAFAQKNEVDSALYYMRKALDNGLTFTRYLAGPKDLLMPIYKTEYFKNHKKEKEIRLIHGPMKEAVTTSAKIWLRTADESDVEIVVSEKSGDVVGSFTANSNEENDYVVVIPITNLKSDTEYNYQISIDENKPERFLHLKHYRKVLKVKSSQSVSEAVRDTPRKMKK